ncbi:hypothetical protein UFOVP116_386 [uncultured Caudovirales phage]|uniref:Uncharacterized protein n=1 Tax=uncultured Caudovirales phage TaxID=2100421 RepID=A0A6J5LAI1_9CAUD|nr:hypothetical protein UFOVP116_386 [uncultured Caudovirales phage]
MIKHIGRHNDKKAVILYRTVPGENHMCLIVYGELIPRLMHDEIMGVLESPVGQQASEFADALFRHTMADGRNALQTLHTEKFIKKVPTNQIVVTPTGNSNVRLDELNSIIDKMQGGEEAVKKMAELDRNSGMKAGNRVEAPATVALSDDELSAQLLGQATKLKAEAQSMIAEAARLEQEAEALKPKAKNGNKKTKNTAEQAESQPA